MEQIELRKKAEAWFAEELKKTTDATAKIDAQNKFEIIVGTYMAAYKDGKEDALHAYESAGVLPNDEQVSKWFEENIDRECSASSAIYKFRLWLKELKVGAGVTLHQIEDEITRRWNSVQYNPEGTMKREYLRMVVLKDMGIPLQFFYTGRTAVWLKASERLPEPFKVVPCKYTPDSPDPRKDTELHWGFVSKDGNWDRGWEQHQVEWLDETAAPAQSGKEADYDNLYRLVYSAFAKLRARTQYEDRMIAKREEIRELIEGTTKAMQSMPQPDNSNEPPYIVQSDKKESGKEDAVAFQDWIRKHEYKYDDDRKYWVQYENGSLELIYLCDTTAQLYDIYNQNK